VHVVGVDDSQGLDLLPATEKRETDQKKQYKEEVFTLHGHLRFVANLYTLFTKYIRFVQDKRYTALSTPAGPQAGTREGLHPCSTPGAVI
jgi:hypothetical protein